MMQSLTMMKKKMAIIKRKNRMILSQIKMTIRSRVKIWRKLKLIKKRNKNRNILIKIKKNKINLRSNKRLTQLLMRSLKDKSRERKELNLRIKQNNQRNRTKRTYKLPATEESLTKRWKKSLNSLRASLKSPQLTKTSSKSLKELKNSFLDAWVTSSTQLSTRLTSEQNFLNQIIELKCRWVCVALIKYKLSKLRPFTVDYFTLPEN